MSLFLIMNATDVQFQELGIGTPVSSLLTPMFSSFSAESLHTMERAAWWIHICGIFAFLNYLYYSKHLHILLAFPNTFYANLKSKGKFPNNTAVTKEVQTMMDPNADPYAMPAEEEGDPEKFGASDVADLNWVQLMNAYTCTECGRCSSVCPANQTGKELSPRAIMMKTRDRLEEVGKNIDANKGTFVDDGKQLLGEGYISQEEIWACTSCNACVEECPVNIDPLSIIMDMRQYLVMEQSSAPQELNAMMSNIENNGAPWPYNQMDRLNWVNEE
jgi:heterodisulfide reductase subunit C